MLYDPKLLVVDDEEVVCQGCRRIFSRQGFQVETSNDSREGLNLARKNDYAVVLLDIKMPMMDGLQFLEKLRGEKPDMPVIFITGFPSVPTAASAVRMGATDYITKPFTPEEITQAVEKTLGRRGKSSKPRHVVLVGADRVSARTQSEQLTSLGCQVRVVSGWDELEPVLCDPECNVLMLDAESFGRHGPALVGQVNQKAPSMKIVVIAPSASEWEAAYRERKIFYYAVEPFADNEIVEVLDAVFQPRRQPLPRVDTRRASPESASPESASPESASPKPMSTAHVKQEATIMLDAVVACNRGIANEVSGQLDRAIAFFSEAIRLNPNFSRAYEGRALVHREAGNLDKALADYTKAIRLNPNDANAYKGRGVGYLVEGGYNREGGYLSVRRQRCFDKAISDFGKAIRLDPKNADLYFWRGTGYRVKGEADKAIANFDEAIRLDPNDARSYLGRARALEQQGETAKAQADYQKVEQAEAGKQCSVATG